MQLTPLNHDFSDNVRPTILLFEKLFRIKCIHGSMRDVCRCECTNALSCLWKSWIVSCSSGSGTRRVSLRSGSRWGDWYNWLYYLTLDTIEAVCNHALQLTCVRKCRCKCCLSTNFREQYEHSKSFMPRWPLMWRPSIVCVLILIPQM